MKSAGCFVVRPTVINVKFSLTLLVSLLFLPALFQSASADEESPPPVYPSLRIIGGGANSASVADSAADVSASWLKGTVEYKDFSFSYQRLDYSWDNINSLPFGNGVDSPWEDLHTLSLGYSKRGELTSNWKYFAGGAISSSFEKEMDNSIGGAAFAGASYAFSPTIELSLGAGFAYHDIKTTVLPVIGISWNQATPQGFSVALGYPNTYAAYRFGPQWAIRTRIVQYEEDVYRLADDSTVEKSGFLVRKDLIGDLGLEYTPTKNLSVILAARYYFDREFTIHDKNDATERSYDVENTWGGVASVKYQF